MLICTEVAQTWEPQGGPRLRPLHSHALTTFCSLFITPLLYFLLFILYPPQFRALPTWMTARVFQKVTSTPAHPPPIQSPLRNQNCLLRRQNGPTSILPTALQYLLTSPSSRSLKGLTFTCLGQLHPPNYHIRQSIRSEERRELSFQSVLENSHSHHTPVGNNLSIRVRQTWVQIQLHHLAAIWL